MNIITSIPERKDRSELAYTKNNDRETLEKKIIKLIAPLIY